MKKILLLCVSLLCLSSIYADRYKVVKIIGDGKIIKIGNVKVAKGLEFSDSETIVWASDSDRQMVKARCLDGKNKGKLVSISKRSMLSRNAQSLYRYVNMMGRGADEVEEILILGDDENEKLPIEAQPSYSYELWFGDQVKSIVPIDGQLYINRGLFGAKKGLFDVWLEGKNQSDGNMTICLNFKVEIF